MKPLLAAIILFVTLLALPGCARNFYAELGATGIEQLRVDGQEIWSNQVHKIAGDPRGVILPREAWPKSILAIAPEAVHIRADGVYIFVASGYLNSQMLFVQCPKCPSLELADTQSRLRELAPHVYELRAH